MNQRRGRGVAQPKMRLLLQVQIMDEQMIPQILEIMALDQLEATYLLQTNLKATPVLGTKIRSQRVKTLA
jgi:hypothetical protein